MKKNNMKTLTLLASLFLVVGCSSLAVNHQMMNKFANEESESGETSEISESSESSESKEEKHEHTFSTDWSYDELSHWHDSTCEHDFIADKADHQFGEWEVVVDATDLKDGYKARTCQVCSFEQREVIPVKEHEHTFVNEWSYDETYHWHESACGYDEISDKGEHSFGEWIVKKEARDEIEGLQYRECETCGYQETEVIEALPHQHSYSDKWSYDDGHHWHASTCFDETVIDYEEHQLAIDYASEAISRIGVAVFDESCSICGYTHDVFFNYNTNWSVDKEKDTHYHAVIDPGFEDMRIAESTHDYSDWEIVYDATESEDGLRKKTCSTCGYVFGERIPATGSVDKLTFTYVTASQAYSVKAKDTSISGDIVIPSKYNGKPVIINTQNAFSGCSEIETVTILEGHTSLSSYCFSNCTSLTTVNLPDSLTTIAQSSFYKCTSLTTINFGEGITTIGSSAFDGSGLISIELPSTITSIGGSAFRDCKSLQSITIPDGITTLKASLFSGCTKLTTINLPDSLVSVESSVFSSCGVTSLHFGKNFSTFNSNTFGYVTHLTSVTFDAENPFFTSDDDCIYNKDKTTLYFFYNKVGQRGYTIIDGVTTIGEYAFYNSYRLSSITFPDSITSIEKAAFSYCTLLTSIVVPSGVETIGWNAFSSCSKLETAILSEGVIAIDSQAFFNDVAIRNLILPKSLESIANDAFNYNSSAGAFFNMLRILFVGSSMSEWEVTYSASSSSLLYNKPIYLYSETEPTEEGNYWHYVEGTPTTWPQIS